MKSTTIGENIEKAADLLNKGELVAIPTETVYGLAANALNPDAVLKIFKAKNRPHFNPLIIHLPDWEAVNKYVQYIPIEAEQLAKAFSPGPITFLLEKRAIIPDLVTAGSEKVAIRIPNHPLTRKLLSEIEFPLAAPSANPFGYVSPTTAEHVLEGLNGKIHYILNGGPCQVGLESTIVDFDNHTVIVRRKGGITVEAVEAILGEKVLVQTGVEEHPVAPGQLKSHYATSTPLHIIQNNDLPADYEPESGCVIAFGNNMEKVPAKHGFQLSASADMDEAAKQLFAIMREADNCGATMILVKNFPDFGLGQAMNDRLKRASFQS